MGSKQGRVAPAALSAGAVVLSLVVTLVVASLGNSLLEPGAALVLAVPALHLEHGSLAGWLLGAALLLVAGQTVERRTPWLWWQAVLGTVLVLGVVQVVEPRVLGGYSGLTAAGHALAAAALLGGWLHGRQPGLWLGAWAALVLGTLVSDQVQVAGVLPLPGAWVTAHVTGVLVGSLVALNRLRQDLLVPA